MATRREVFSPLPGLIFLAPGPEVVVVIGEVSQITWRQLGVIKQAVPQFPTVAGRGSSWNPEQQAVSRTTRIKDND